MMKARTINKIVILKLSNKSYEATDYHAIVKGSQITFPLHSFSESPLVEESGVYVVGIKGRITEEEIETIGSLAENLNVPNPYGEDESLDTDTDFD